MRRSSREMALMPLNQHGRADGTMPDATELPAADHAPHARDRRAPRVARPVPTGALQGAPSPQSAKAWGRLQFRPPDRSDCRVHAFHTWRTSVRGCMAIAFEEGSGLQGRKPSALPRAWRVLSVATRCQPWLSRRERQPGPEQRGLGPPTRSDQGHVH